MNLKLCRSSLVLSLVMFLAACQSSSPRREVAPVAPCENAHYVRPTPGVALPWIAVAGRCLVDGAGRSLVLRGVSIPDPEHLEVKRGDGTSLALFRRAVTEFGASVVRLPIHKGDGTGTGFVEDPLGYAQTYLDPLVDEAERLGAYVVLDLHLIADFLPEKAFVLSSWDLLAARYGHRSHVIFELFNEPIGPEDWHIWVNEVARPALSRIRAHAPKTLVIVGGPHWSVMMRGALDEPLEDGPVAYTAHVYPEIDESLWRSHYEPLLARHPLFVTEWGFDRESVYPLRGTLSNFGKPFGDWLGTYQLSWTAWIFDNQWAETMFDAEWRLKGGDDAMGEFVRDLLRTTPDGNESGRQP